MAKQKDQADVPDEIEWMTPGFMLPDAETLAQLQAEKNGEKPLPKDKAPKDKARNGKKK